MQFGDSLPKVTVLGLPVVDATRDELVGHLARSAMNTERPTTAFALHIGGVMASRSDLFLAAMKDADVVYGDGVSAVVLSRIAGATRLERTPTTDIGWDLLRELRREAGRPARVAAVGGPDGLSARAIAELRRQGLAGDGLATHGYHRDWRPVLTALWEQRPEVILVGMGAPLEMLWVRENLDRLPPALVLTCGGWFGFIVADEIRAPTALQQVGLEWAYRWSRDPLRLTGRYLRGLFAFPLLAARVVAERWRRG